jgi:hypothetical protein
MRTTGPSVSCVCAEAAECFVEPGLGVVPNGASQSLRLQNMVVAALGVAGALTLAACSDSPPTAPSPGTSSVTVSISGGPALFIGSSSQLVARETLADGSTRVAASANWSSDNSHVAGVSTLGVMTARAAGEANIVADVNGVRGALLIRVLPNFGGAWQGWQIVEGCEDSGALAGLCSRDWPVGRTFRFLALFRQNLASVTADLSVEDGNATMTGTISIDGELRLEAATVRPDEDGLAYSSENWRSRADTPSRMTGTYDLVATIPGMTGSLRLGLRLDSVPRIVAGNGQ